ncbi:hypothetical protein RB653_000939 [Dictyostelium firmibasis]|uniref:Transmembrane protein n=1 Tax=Dictyostelium firmibasis TaxID=79012 RepID=A0AAN7TW29_9MYCE
MNFKILIILLLNLIFLKSIVYSQQQISYYVQTNGSDSSYCGRSTQQSCASVFGAVESFRYQFGSYSSSFYQIIIYFGVDYQWIGGSSESSVNLYNMNVSFVGNPDGSTYFLNSYAYLPLFNVTSSTQNTYITFNNITYGSPTSNCWHNFQVYNNNTPVTLLLLQPSNYGDVGTYVQFNNFSLNCQVIDIPVIAVIDNDYISNPSEDYNGFQYFYMTTDQPNIFITFNNFTFNQSISSTLNSEFLYAPSIPTSVTFVNSLIKASNILSNSQNFITVGRGCLLIDNSTFNIGSSGSSLAYFLNVSSTQVDITNTNITIQRSIVSFLTCQGCFFKADNINFTSIVFLTSQYPFYFIYASASFYNSIMISDGINIIKTIDCQLSLRMNTISSSMSNPINIDNTNIFIYGNSFPSFSPGGSMSSGSSLTPIYCTSSSDSNVISDESTYPYTENCSKYAQTFKLKWYFGFLAVGIVGTLCIFVFLASTIAIIKRCGGGDH